ncbi:branched-chain amino acid ABC transporter permease [Candidatus Geothermarchaeota archaeon]|nr:MAG: branched-chain amino acid ABC transporter permease [Candidatus Geothermarchaeota archaeon]
MIEPIYMDALVFSSLLTLLSIGLTMTYLTTRVPNFAHGSLAMIGTYVSLTVDKVFKASIYQNLYLSFIASGLAALTIYLLILKPLRNRGASIDALMIATLAIDIILLAIFNIYTDILIREFKAVTGRKFLLRSSDLIIFNQRAALIVSLALVVVLTTALYLLLTRTKFGIAMRAVIENPSLAATVGINTELVYSVSWFIAGGLAGISGGLLPLWFLCDPAFGSTIVVSIFAASIVGGLYNIYGAC